MKTNYDYFDLESEIQNVWHTKDDLDAITERIYDDPEGPMTEDEIGNVLLGLSELHETRCKKLWKVFEAILKDRADVPKDAISPSPMSSDFGPEWGGGSQKDEDDEEVTNRLYDKNEQTVSIKEFTDRLDEMDNGGDDNGEQSDTQTRNKQYYEDKELD
jgi:hypothetical protein